jgi:phage terminase Nu1 subunit (DNA packaging protein)
MKTKMKQDSMEIERQALVEIAEVERGLVRQLDEEGLRLLVEWGRLATTVAVMRWDRRRGVGASQGAGASPARTMVGGVR